MSWYPQWLVWWKHKLMHKVQAISTVDIHRKLLFYYYCCYFWTHFDVLVYSYLCFFCCSVEHGKFFRPHDGFNKAIRVTWNQIILFGVLFLLIKSMSGMRVLFCSHTQSERNNEAVLTFMANLDTIEFIDPMIKKSSNLFQFRNFFFACVPSNGWIELKSWSSFQLSPALLSLLLLSHTLDICIGMLNFLQTYMCTVQVGEEESRSVIAFHWEFISILAENRLTTTILI